jgi:hypothetical protein
MNPEVRGMEEGLADFCRRYQVEFVGDPEVLPHSCQSWLITDVKGDRWVAKAKPPEETIAEQLKSFAVLYPPFLYPRPVSQPSDPYLLYPYIEGTVLADGLFEQEDMIDRVMEVIGRIQALMRSLNLASFYQEALRPRESMQDAAGRMDARFSLGWLQVKGDQEKRGRHREIAESFQWTEACLQEWSGAVQSQQVWPRAPLAAYQDHIRKNFSMHVPVVASNLCHTAMQPEHLLLCPGGEIGILGWYLHPRPRFYMVYTYLAWSLLHSKRPDGKEYYRGFLVKNSNTSFYDEHHRVFALCLLEQAAWSCQEGRAERSRPSEERLREAEELFSECIENLAKSEKKAVEFPSR